MNLIFNHYDIWRAIYYLRKALLIVDERYFSLTCFTQLTFI